MNKLISDKIDLLFEYRRLPFVLDNYGLLDSSIYSDMKELQYLIFLYDKYLEENWSLNQEELDKRWAAIVLLMKGMGYGQEDALKELRHIAIYSKNEQSTRNNVSLADLPIRYFYYYKSCDVKLMRRILYKHRANVKTNLNPNAWLAFDMITEVNDDVLDVEEDLGTFNGNRYLKSLESNGVDYAVSEYSGFTDRIEAWSKRRERHLPQDFQGVIHNWTKEEVVRTNKILTGRNWGEILTAQNSNI